MSAPIVIVEYNPEWPYEFKDEKRRIRVATNKMLGEIIHIGSTAVPYTCAKPIIDIMASVQGASEADEILPVLVAIGYDDVTKIEGSDEWFYCLGRAPEIRKEKIRYYHLHLVKEDSDHWRRHVLFRDYLRCHPEIAREYCEMKKKLAKTYRTQREIYTESKTKFIDRIIKRAENLG